MSKIRRSGEKSSDNLPTGHYEGIYTRKANKFVREDDGLELKILERDPQLVTPARTPQYLVDGPHYVSSLYGSEFEHNGVRYEITHTGSGTYEITVLYVGRQKPLDAEAVQEEVDRLSHLLWGERKRGGT